MRSGPAGTPGFAFNGVDKSYREGGRARVVFQGLTARFGRGGVTALLGRSGSGKSTLLNLLGAIDVADAGRVSVGGVDLGALGECERTLWRRSEVGIVFQFFNLIPTLDVRENVMLPLELAGVRARASEARALEMLAAVGLADRGASFPEALSGGEQQRVAIARALVARPPLVLADEPTGNLDHETAGEVLDLLVRLAAETAGDGGDGDTQRRGGRPGVADAPSGRIGTGRMRRRRAAGPVTPALPILRAEFAGVVRKRPRPA